ncbi:MAG: 3-deoxy-manno-octulosonate cytidylyltransferase [Deltaproteobacteria bacterium]|nr:3-deoxy-manno-octulosonate cytidylyltransferase [Deltaproteobacteria bacterium]
MKKIVCIIPSRFHSSRFPGKPLADLHGKPMIQHVYEGVLRSPLVTDVFVSSDDERIINAVVSFGGKAIKSSTSNRSGTDRVAEGSNFLKLKDTDIVVNIQGDQPLFEAQQIDEVVQPLLDDETLPMATLIYEITNDAEITHPNAVKTVYDTQGNALYFSRATIPYVRDAGLRARYYKHHGIYAYRKWFLDIFAKLPTGTLEQLEALEQLRALENGYRVRVVVSQFDSLEVDTPAELEAVRQQFSKSQGM